jgi:hypothetical protein
VGFGPHATARAGDKLKHRLDNELPFADRDLRSQDFEAIQAQHPRGRRTTVLTHLGPPVLQTSDTRKICEVPGVLTAPTLPSSTHRTTFHDVEPLFQHPHSVDSADGLPGGADQPVAPTVSV